MKKSKLKSHIVKRNHKKQTDRTRFLSLNLAFVSLACFIFGLLLGIVYILTPSSFCANSISCIKDLSGTYKPGQKGEYLGQSVFPPAQLADLIPAGEAVLGTATGADKHIYIDLTNQKLLAFEGNKLLYNFPVSTGWWNKTPTGNFTIWIKLRYSNMAGGDKAKGDYYNLPNVPFVMYFYNAQYPKWDGYGMHDAYWLHAADFGHPRSHGCINLSLADSETLYNWATPTITGAATLASDTNPGTPLTIYGVTPDHYW